ncbi:MAG: hypothetical protein HOP12_07470 [Candidatus Eisenbacteria bacterium]|uniref:Helix-turn-helix domain-containing protein n=1 Tax=Eiseniibacteriota bacterium TaxID=2212470 RepID=A0A849SF39_UNCEI|nr:hypothetical protein [Candidatus Eisenbacteria bacterium]
MSDLKDLLSQLWRQAGDSAVVPAEVIPELLGVLRLIEVRLLARQLTPRPEAASAHEASPPDAWLTADEVAVRLRRTRPWVYRQARRWTFAKRPSRKTLLISERGLTHWMQHR